MDDKNSEAVKIDRLLNNDLFGKIEGVKDLFSSGISNVSLSSFLDFLENLSGSINKDFISRIDDVFKGKSEEEREKIREIIKEKLAEKYKK